MKKNNGKKIKDKIAGNRVKKNRIAKKEQKRLFLISGRRMVINSYWLNIAVVFVLSAILSGVGVMLSDAADMVVIRWYMNFPLLFILNMAPLTLLMLFFYHLTSRQWPGFFLGGGLFTLLQIVNRFKINLREEPFTLEDVLLGAEAANVVKLSGLPFGPLVAMTCIFWLLVGLFLFIFVKTERKLHLAGRIAGAVAAVGLFTGIYLGVYSNTGFYNSFPVRGSIYSRLDQFKSRGFIYSFLVKANSYKSIKPEGYDKDEARRQLAEYRDEIYPQSLRYPGSLINAGNAEDPGDAANLGNLPHIIAVMGEAFYDIDKIPGIEFDEGVNPLENFNRIKEQAYSGRIVTNVFGGGTANTEFAFLTGHSMPVMPDMSSPYISYIRKDTFSLARVLARAGYSTIAFHPGHSWFYNRANVYDFFGFDDIYFMDALDQGEVTLNHGYISDMDTYDFLLSKFLAHLDEKPGVPLFEFVVTIDNHGPYSREDLGYPKILKDRDNINKPAYNIINNYLNGLMRCDRALDYLVDSIDKIEDPVVFLFFGDHLPYLGENNLGYDALNYKISQSKDLGAYLNQYETPYFIYSNEAFKKMRREQNPAFSEGETASVISANYLATEIFDYTGLYGGAYYNFISALKEKLPVITNRFVQGNGEFTENISEETRSLLDEYAKLQYYMFVEKEAVGG